MAQVLLERVSARSGFGPTRRAKREGRHKKGWEERINTYLWLNDLEIAYLNTTSRKVGDLKLDLNGSLALAAACDTAHTSAKASHHATTFIIVPANRWQAKLGSHQELLATTELFDFPDNG